MNEKPSSTKFFFPRAVGMYAAVILPRITNAIKKNEHVFDHKRRKYQINYEFIFKLIYDTRYPKA